MADDPRLIGDVSIRRFVLDRKVDVTGVSGTGVVAVGCLFVDVDIAVVHWLGEFPTSVVWHSRGMESIEAVHGHGGHTRIVFLDDEVGDALDLFGLIEANLGPMSGDQVLLCRDVEFYDDGDGEALLRALVDQAVARGVPNEREALAQHVPVIIHSTGAVAIELLDEAVMAEHGWMRIPPPVLTVPRELTDEEVAALKQEFLDLPFTVQVTADQLEAIRYVRLDRDQRKAKVAEVLAHRLGHPPTYALAIADAILDALDKGEP